jgi:Ca2+-binding RTX toxin-like protein
VDVGSNYTPGTSPQYSYIVGGTPGNDLIFGSLGNDWIEGFGGDDYLIGIVGDDNLWGNEGNDIVVGGDGNDWLGGGAGRDTLVGGNDNDQIWADGLEADGIVDGGAGDDTIQASAAGSTIEGGDGNDTISFDVYDTDVTGTLIDGGNGNNTYNVYLGTTASGQMTIRGGTNFDNYYLSLRSGVVGVAIEDQQGSNLWLGWAEHGASLDGNAISSFAVGPDVENIILYQNTGPSNELFTLHANDKNNYISGSANNEIIFAGAGDDYIGTNIVSVGPYPQVPLYGEVHAGDGNDTLEGGYNELLFGDAGDDTIQGNDGSEFYGGSGNDAFLFWAGHGVIKDYERGEHIINKYISGSVQPEPTVMDPSLFWTATQETNGVLLSSGSFSLLVVGDFAVSDFVASIEWVATDMFAGYLPRLQITTVNESPTALALSANSVAENSAGGTVVGLLSGTDPDIGQSGTLTFALSDASGNFEIINGNQLAVKSGAVLDFEGTSSFEVDVTTTDSGGLTRTGTFAISISDVNEAPTAVTVTGSSVSLSEDIDTTTRIAMGSIAIADDALGSNVVTLSGEDATLFEVDGTTLYLKSNVSLDFETNSNLDVIVNVADTSVAGASAVSTNVSVAIANVHEAPTSIALSKTSVQEFRANGTVVATLLATDPDTGDSFAYALTNSAGGRFAIVGDQLRVANGLLLDREQSPSHTIGVRVTDSGGNSFNKSFTIAVSDVNPENITGNSLANTLKGGSAADTFNGGAGNDKLYGQSGNDTLIGGTGDDTLTGGTGRDVMTGSSGADDFDFNSITEMGKAASTRDRITDFTRSSDDIDLSTIDANGSAAGNAAFKFIAAKGAAFTGVKGQLKWSQINAAGTANDKTIIEGDINGDGRPDFQIELAGLKTLTSGDFIL